jgi:signal transduction histidine kinase
MTAVHSESTPTRSTAPAAAIDLAAAPLSMPILAALSISLCMAILGLPDLGHGYGVVFRGAYLGACAFWLGPLVFLQRALWRRHRAWWLQALVILIVTYLMSLLNAVLGQYLGIYLGLSKQMRWGRIAQGLDGCWLALIAFCAVHAVAVYYAALARAQLQLATALAAAREAELRALRYQIHPHFLFNTLNAVSALVAAQRNREANRMIAHLAEFLRATLEHDDRHEHALADELALTESYIDIEKARLGERLQLATHIGPDILDACVPYLILQPLVENAIRHGIARRSAAGQLELRLWRDGARLCIEVDNDGVPAAAQQQPAGGVGVGLSNIGDRLAKLYPGDHLFRSEATDDGGYRVRIELPWRVAPARLAA